jgi:hypothetical protein
MPVFRLAVTRAAAVNATNSGASIVKVEAMAATAENWYY